MMGVYQFELVRDKSSYYPWKVKKNYKIKKNKQQNNK